MAQRWEARLRLASGALGERMGDVWAAGMHSVIVQNTAHAIADIQALLAAPDGATRPAQETPSAPLPAAPRSDLDIRH